MKTLNVSPFVCQLVQTLGNFRRLEGCHDNFLSHQYGGNLLRIPAPVKDTPFVRKNKVRGG